MSTNGVALLSVLLAICIIYYSQSNVEKENTLVLTSVVFRHGDRTPDALTVYPNDPYKHDTYHPIGVGQLTTQGKRRSIQLGKLLRSRYGSFLGEEWDFEKIESFSSDYTRNKMTLQAVHAALLPPKNDERVDDGLNWQPVDYAVIPLKDDYLIATHIGCRRIFHEMGEFEKNNVEIQNILAENKEFLEYLSLHTGWNVNKTTFAFLLYSSLKSQVEWGYALPEWAEKVYPEPLYQLAAVTSKIYANNLKYRKVMIGNLLKKITINSQQKADGTLKSSGRKMYLYSAHESNVIGLLGAFDIYNGEDVPYNCYLLFELHKIDNVYGMKVFYHDYSTDDPVQIDITNCGSFCPVDKFYDLLKHNFPGENWCNFE